MFADFGWPSAAIAAGHACTVTLHHSHGRAFFFGRPKTDDERAQENRDTIRTAVRQAKRQHDRSERDQVATIREIRAKALMAKTLVRQRNQAKRFSKIATQLEALSGRMNELRSIQDMNRAMASVARMMQSMNAQMMAATMRSIEYENEKMEKFQLWGGFRVSDESLEQGMHVPQDITRCRILLRQQP